MSFHVKPAEQLYDLAEIMLFVGDVGDRQLEQPGGFPIEIRFDHRKRVRLEMLGLANLGEVTGDIPPVRNTAVNRPLFIQMFHDFLDGRGYRHFS